MAYSVVADVLRVLKVSSSADLGTTDPDITKFIEEADSWINRLIGAQSESDKTIRELSAKMAALSIVTSDPYQEATGGLMETRWSVGELRARIKEILASYSTELCGPEVRRWNEV